MKQFIKYVALVLIIMLVGAGYYIYLSKKMTSQKKITAADTNVSLSSQVDWESGSLSSALDTTTIPGSMVIDTGEEEISLSGKSVLSDIYNEDSIDVIDGDELHGGWAFTEIEGSGHWWKMDLGTVETSISKVSIYAASDAAVEYQLQYSDNDISYTTWGNLTHGTLTWEDNPISPTIDARYIKIVVNFSGMPGEASGLSEIKLYQAALSATHTTASTQIDGQEGSANKTLIEWTSFEVTGSTPLGTSISYEFRVSNDAENWTDWTGDFLSLEARRYLQIKATLTTTNVLVTPQIDDYTINFHNNQAPNAPTAETAVIGD